MFHKNKNFCSELSILNSTSYDLNIYVLYYTLYNCKENIFI